MVLPNQSQQQGVKLTWTDVCKKEEGLEPRGVGWGEEVCQGLGFGFSLGYLLDWYSSYAQFYNVVFIFKKFGMWCLYYHSVT